MRYRPRHGFTLVEMLVVIGIMAILASLLLLATDKAISAANRSRSLADMQSITSGMAAYISDFGDIPHPGLGMGGFNKYNDTGAWAMTQALLGPASAATDNHDGWGFSLRKGGRAYGPYLAPEKFKLSAPQASSGGAGTYYEILDRFGHAILYFPASARFTASQLQYVAPSSGAYVPVYVGNSLATDNASTATSYPCVEIDSATGYTDVYMYEWGEASQSYNVGNNQNEIALHKLRAMFGDFDYNGGIGAATYQNGTTVQETAFYTGRYILYSAGPDGLFGPPNNPYPYPYKPSDISSCDDIILSVDW